MYASQTVSIENPDGFDYFGDFYIGKNCYLLQNRKFEPADVTVGNLGIHSFYFSQSPLRRTTSRSYFDRRYSLPLDIVTNQGFFHHVIVDWFFACVRRIFDPVGK